eukprot:284816589_5
MEWNRPAGLVRPMLLNSDASSSESFPCTPCAVPRQSLLRWSGWRLPWALAWRTRWPFLALVDTSLQSHRATATEIRLLTHTVHGCQAFTYQTEAAKAEMGCRFAGPSQSYNASSRCKRKEKVSGITFRSHRKGPGFNSRLIQSYRWQCLKSNRVCRHLMISHSFLQNCLQTFDLQQVGGIVVHSVSIGKVPDSILGSIRISLGSVNRTRFCRHLGWYHIPFCRIVCRRLIYSGLVVWYHIPFASERSRVQFPANPIVSLAVFKIESGLQAPLDDITFLFAELFADVFTAGWWCSGITFRLHRKGPGFNSLLIQSYRWQCLKSNRVCRHLMISHSFLQNCLQTSYLQRVGGVVVSHSVCIGKVPGSIPGSIRISLAVYKIALGFAGTLVGDITFLFAELFADVFTAGWCSGITFRSHRKGPGFNSRLIQSYRWQCLKSNRVCRNLMISHSFLQNCLQTSDLQRVGGVVVHSVCIGKVPGSIPGSNRIVGSVNRIGFAGTFRYHIPFCRIVCRRLIYSGLVVWYDISFASERSRVQFPANPFVFRWQYIKSHSVLQAPWLVISHSFLQNCLQTSDLQRVGGVVVSHSVCIGKVPGSIPGSNRIVGSVNRIGFAGTFRYHIPFCRIVCRRLIYSGLVVWYHIPFASERSRVQFPANPFVFRWQCIKSHSVLQAPWLVISHSFLQNCLQTSDLQRLGGVVVSHSVRIGKVPGSIPGSIRISLAGKIALGFAGTFYHIPFFRIVCRRLIYSGLVVWYHIPFASERSRVQFPANPIVSLAVFKIESGLQAPLDDITFLFAELFADVFTAGWWCSGMTFRLHRKGPGFNSRLIHSYFVGSVNRTRFCRHLMISHSFLQNCLQTSDLQRVGGIVVSHSVRIGKVPGSIPGSNRIVGSVNRIGFAGTFRYHIPFCRIVCRRLIYSGLVVWYHIPFASESSRVQFPANPFVFRWQCIKSHSVLQAPWLVISHSFLQNCLQTSDLQRVGGVVVSHSVRIGKVPGSIPGSNRIVGSVNRIGFAGTFRYHIPFCRIVCRRLIHSGLVVWYDIPFASERSRVQFPANPFVFRWQCIKSHSVLQAPLDDITFLFAELFADVFTAGWWYSGITFRSHRKGPGFDSRLIQSYRWQCLKSNRVCRHLMISHSFLQNCLQTSDLQRVGGVVVSHSVCIGKFPGSIPGSIRISLAV